MKILTSPSLFASDLLNIEKEVRRAEAAGADTIHFDIMDGVYVPNLSIGFDLLAQVRKITDLPIDAHMMTVCPEKYIDRLADAGADIVTVHNDIADAGAILDMFEEIHNYGMLAAVALKPAVPAEAVLPFLDNCDMVLVMTVEPGFSGQKFNDMSDKIRNLTIEQYDAEIKRQQNQLKMLRAQVKPHTFLNAINTINNMTYTGKGEDIRKYIAAFASFTRYMMYKAKDWTTVEDEVKNIESYTRMQQIRFPESIEVTYDIDKEIYNEQIPYLILFSLVENSFKHAMTLTNKAYITIKGEYYEEEGFRGFRLIEEDNGPGFSKEALEKIETAEADDPFTKEHLGLTNVRYSLNLIYKRDDLLRIFNREEGGAHIELLIPQQEADDETVSM